MVRSLQLLTLACLMAIAIPTNASADDWRRSLGQGFGTYEPSKPGKSSASSTKSARSGKSATRTARATTSSDDDAPVRRSRSRSSSTASSSRSSGSSGSEFGIASYYWQPQRVASGGWFNPNAMTAAHKYLPFGTRVRVTHLSSGRTVDVTINDRGPFIAGRIIDLSRAAAGVIGMQGSGIAQVRVDVLGR